MISVVSMGGGVNSTALLIGLRDRGERPDAILFADTGGENPSTYRHVEAVNLWCHSAGFPEVTVVKRNTPLHESLEEECHNNGTLPSKTFGFGGCSEKWKRTPMDKWVKAWPLARKEWDEGRRVARLIGIHARETKRGKIPDCDKFHYRFPLREWGWSQDECADACLRAYGYIPGKSSCFFCPAMRKP
jgi:3'-phosphoadenosine 5'-phosphosulfate sulfotransferase (PAPS reductase)/FAD synthetase